MSRVYVWEAASQFEVNLPSAVFVRKMCTDTHLFELTLTCLLHTHTQRHGQTDRHRHTDRHTDRHTHHFASACS